MSMLVCENGCGQEYDPTLEVQCRRCGHQLGTDPVVIPPPPPPAPPSRLIVTICGRDFPVEEDQPVGLGRDLRFGEIADALADAANVSRVHAILRFSEGKVYVQDSGSANGTFVDGARIPTDHEYELVDGQSLRLAADVPIQIRKES